ncbi:MAG: peptidase M28, partial [Meiothermus sp.]
LEQSGARFNDIGGSGGSDHTPFAQAGVPVLFFHWGIDPNYHQPTDTVADPKLLAETAEVVQAALERILKQ